MKIVPAIDILQDRLVRLVQGREEHKTDYLINPVKAAHEFYNQGSEILHIIDLSATLGKGDSTSTIMKIRKEINLPLQVGGGLRTYDRAAYLLDHGVDQVILGTMVVEHPEIFQKLLYEYGTERIIAAIDYAQRKVVTHGWTRLHQHLDPLVAIKSLKHEYQLKWILLTDTTRDGTLQGPDLTFLAKAAKTSTNIIAAGGVGTLHHISKVKETGVTRLVIGKALLDKQFTLKEAVKVLNR